MVIGKMDDSITGIVRISDSDFHEHLNPKLHAFDTQILKGGGVVCFIALPLATSPKVRDSQHRRELFFGKFS
jgi:hypothetical protein